MIEAIPGALTAQPTGGGKAAQRASPRAHKQRSVVWINLREEPVLYVNGRPFALRDGQLLVVLARLQLVHAHGLLVARLPLAVVLALAVHLAHRARARIVAARQERRHDYQ